MIFSDKVVQVGFVEELITIDVIEESSETYKGAHSHDSEDDAIPSEKALLRNDGLVRIATPGDEVMITVDVEIEDEAENDRVDLEVNCKSEEETRQNIPSLEQEVDRDEYQRLDDLIIRATAAHSEEEGVQDQS